MDHSITGLVLFTLFVAANVLKSNRISDDGNPIETNSTNYVDEFIQNGVVVIKNIFSKEEIIRIREQFHASLHQKGCDVRDLQHTAQHLRNLSSTGGSGGVLDIFY